MAFRILFCVLGIAVAASFLSTPEEEPSSEAPSWTVMSVGADEEDDEQAAAR